MRIWAVGAALLAAAAALAVQRGSVASFEDPADLQKFRASGVQMERVSEHASDGKWALKVTFPGAERDTWPGFHVPVGDGDFSDQIHLVFEAYNASGKRARLSWRVDDAAGKKVYGGASLAAGRMQTVLVPIYAYKYDLDVKRVARIYIYISRPRETWVIYFDNFRFQRPSDLRRPIIHVPRVQPPSAPAEEGPAFVVFRRNWMEHVFADDWPAEGEQAQRLSVYAARGEYEPLTVSVAARRHLQGLAVSISDFAGPGRIPARAVDVRVVQHLDKKLTYSDRAFRFIIGIPVYLEPVPDGGVDIEAGRVVRFWLTVHVPKRARPGTYRAKLRITCRGEEAVELPVRLFVWPFELPEPERKFYGVYYTGPSRFEKGDRIEILRRHLRDMREHGMTSVGLCFGWNIEQTDIERGRVDFLPPGEGLYETFMREYSKLKFPSPVIQLADTPQHALASKYDWRSEQFARRYAAIWQFVMQWGRRMKWPEIFVQPVDEPAWQPGDAKERNVALLRILKTMCEGIRTEQDGPGDDYFHNVAGPWADFWCYNGGLAEPDVIRRAKEQGKIIAIYNCDVEWYRPVVDRYVAGWFQEVAGIDGCFNWAYQSFGGSPYDDGDTQTGGHLAVYPPGEGRAGGPSCAWEAYREGIDDFRYIALCRQLIERARKARSRKALELAAEAERILEELRGSISYSPRVRGTARWESWKAEDGRIVITGALNLPNGWGLDDYDRARRRVARICAELVRAM